MKSLTPPLPRRARALAVRLLSGTEVTLRQLLRASNRNPETGGEEEGVDDGQTLGAETSRVGRLTLELAPEDASALAMSQ